MISKPKEIRSCGALPAVAMGETAGVDGEVVVAVVKVESVVREPLVPVPVGTELLLVEMDGGGLRVLLPESLT
jgi:hypothetical protein